MSSRTLHPKWWQVYLMLPLLVVLFILDNRLQLPIFGHQVIQIGIVLLVYGYIHVWLKANARALSNMDRERVRGRVTVIQVPMSSLSASDKKQFAEVKGMLSNTFEMEMIDADAFPVDKVSQEIKKE